MPLAEFLEKTKNSRTLENIQEFSNEDQETVIEYLQYLESNELGFWTDEPERFPNLNLQWKSPEYINNAIIEIEQLDNTDIKKITTALTNLYCKYIELRLYKTVSLDKISFFVENCSESVIRSITVFLPFTPDLDIEEIENLSIKYPRIVLFVLHSVQEKYTLLKTKNPKIRFVSRTIDNRNHCGIIDPKLFSIKIPVFTESLNHNSCLNKKLSVDIDGNIKNCPSMSKSFGNVKTHLLEEVVNSSDFQKVWSINKEKVNICKDCEYRHVCTDCRAYVENPEDQFSKPLKCGYDPYTNTWEEWSTNPLKREALKYYNFQEFLNG
ncbi:hypothetical protein GCM10022258_26340 [Aquimarina gracilis]